MQFCYVEIQNLPVNRKSKSIPQLELKVILIASYLKENNTKK